MYFFWQIFRAPFNGKYSLLFCIHGRKVWMVPWRYRPNILFAISDLLPYGSLNLKWGCYWVPSSFPFLRFHFHRPHPYSKWVKNWKNSEINLWWIESTYNELRGASNFTARTSNSLEPRSIYQTRTLNPINPFNYY